MLKLQTLELNSLNHMEFNHTLTLTLCVLGVDKLKHLV